MSRAGRLPLGLATLFGLRRGGFFIPYRHAAALPAAGAVPVYEPFERLLRAREAAFAGVLAAMDAHADALAAFDGAEPPAPRWQQDWFPRLDGAAAYALMRRHRPARVVEVGSGHSTRFLVRALADEGVAATVTAIDPQPRARVAGLGVRHLAVPLHAAGPEPFAALGPGDVLFIDSSHILMPGSDVDTVVGRILPLLPAGVLVHVHDVFLPDDYPADWAWRGYNEQQAAMALLAGGGFEVLWASHYAATRMAAAVAASAAGRLPLPPGARESSLWLRKTAPALTAT
ncbi:class I SAM-dependent methyltransferase [Azospirillum halopraeferens]|uniref:class I SAM-dependent methyltransferase n=1 Tax=Azospirillum halopraeferens TaxID=34010 RepID=UPI0004139E6C|nr:class I SAM-dependent methyltransferase [Azospirillum halopraeferens]